VFYPIAGWRFHEGRWHWWGIHLRLSLCWCVEEARWLCPCCRRAILQRCLRFKKPSWSGGVCQRPVRAVWWSNNVGENRACLPLAFQAGVMLRVSVIHEACRLLSLTSGCGACNKIPLNGNNLPQDYKKSTCLEAVMCTQWRHHAHTCISSKNPYHEFDRFLQTKTLAWSTPPLGTCPWPMPEVTPTEARYLLQAVSYLFAKIHQLAHGCITLCLCFLHTSSSLLKPKCKCLRNFVYVFAGTHVFVYVCLCVCVF
jgi:hypothetical protein